MNNLFPFLVIEPDVSLGEKIYSFFSNNDIPVVIESDLNSGFRRFIEQRDSIVYISDDNKTKERIALIRKIKGIKPDAPIVVAIPEFKESIIREYLKVGALRFIQKPIDLTSLKDIYLELNSVAIDLRKRELVIKYICFEDRVFVMDNDINAILPISLELVRPLKYIVVGNTEIDDLVVSISEVLRNAIEHGNLEITYEEKQKAVMEGRYSELIKDRCRDDKYKNRKVFINYRLDFDKVTIRIKDEGKGFNWRSMYKKLKKISKMSSKPTGRGLIIIKMGVDKVYFNRKGNEVTLIKFFNRYYSKERLEKIRSFIGGAL